MSSSKITLTFRDYTPARTTLIDPEIVDLLVAMDAAAIDRRDIARWIENVFPYSSGPQRESLIRLVFESPGDGDHEAASRHGLSLDIETDGGVWGEFPEPGTKRIFDVVQSYDTGLWSVMPDASLADILDQRQKIEFHRLSTLLRVLAPHRTPSPSPCRHPRNLP